MAKLTKTAKKIPLAESEMMFSAHFNRAHTVDAISTRITVEGEQTESGRGRYYRLDLDRAETIRFFFCMGGASHQSQIQQWRRYTQTMGSAS